MVQCLNEIYIRFKDRDIRFRYTQQVLAQWTLFTSFVIMLTFATRHGAGKPKFNFRKLFIPIHCLYLTMLILGYSPKYGAYCVTEPYPRIFFVQTAFFFCIFGLFRFMKSKDYYIDWSPESEIPQGINGKDIDDHFQRSAINFEQDGFNSSEF